MSYAITKFYLTHNDCYTAYVNGKRRSTTAGVIRHSTGCNNTSLARYINSEKFGKVGTNHWNKTGISKCVHFMIGLDASGNVRIVQTLPLDARCWGCGSGSKGSYNNSHIQYEVLEDGRTDGTYYQKVMAAADWLDSYLLHLYGLDSSALISHKEAHDRGYATAHTDCDSWMTVFGDTMSKARNRVKLLMAASSVASSDIPATTVSAQSYERAREKDPAIAGTYKCTASKLNVRRGAGTDKTVVAQITKNDTVKCYGYYTDLGDDRWLLVKTSAGVIGHASAAYLSKQ